MRKYIEKTQAIKGSQWSSKNNRSAAHGGLRHKALYGSIDQQAPPQCPKSLGIFCLVMDKISNQYTSLEIEEIGLPIYWSREHVSTETTINSHEDWQDTLFALLDAVELEECTYIEKLLSRLWSINLDL